MSKRLLLPWVLLLLLASSLWAIGPAKTIFVSPSGSDSPRCGQSPAQACKTLEAAYGAIDVDARRVARQPYDIVLLAGSIGEAVQIGPSEWIKWEKSGSSENPITIRSRDSRVRLTRNKQVNPAFQLVGVKNVHFRNVHFFAMTPLFQFDHAENCSVEASIWEGTLIPVSEAPGSGGGAGIHLQNSRNNRIVGNRIKEHRVSPPKKERFWQAIYLSLNSHDNVIENNTIEVPKQLGSGIATTLSNNYSGNLIRNNLVAKWFRLDYDDKYGIDLRGSDGTVTGNRITGNRIFADGSRLDASGCYNLQGQGHHLQVSEETHQGNKPYCDRNVVANNILFTGNPEASSNLVPVDPYWEGYWPDNFKGRVVAGSFDSTKGQDIATLYDMGDGRASLHLFLFREGALKYETWWESDTGSDYPLKNVGGRMVVGDFDNDKSKTDDIATFFDRGDGNAWIHVWLSRPEGESGHFQYRTWWANDSAQPFDATKIVDGSLVAGDFNGDGHQDIAAFYDYAPFGAVRTRVWLGTSASFEEANSPMGFPWLVKTAPPRTVE